MPDYIVPGVSIEETSFRAKRIEPAPTSVTVLLGTCPAGPGDEVVAVESLADFDHGYPEASGSPLRRAVQDFFSHGGRQALTVRVTDGTAALANLAEHDWQLLVVDPEVIDLATAHTLCLQHRAFLVCDATDDGTLPAGLGNNAAAYFPPFTSGPCAPAVAGVFAQNDARRGIWASPAGTGATVKLPLSRELTKKEIDVLVSRQVNALRTLPSGKAVVWSARTASADPQWKYVPVRRLLLFLERSIERGLHWVVFEPNGETLWAQARQTVSDFLSALWRQGALAGRRPDEAYFVRCDRSTMTQVDIDAGRLVVLVGVATVKPAEFVIFRITAQTSAAV